jgi:hypothetical protein
MYWCDNIHVRSILYGEQFTHSKYFRFNFTSWKGVRRKNSKFFLKKKKKERIAKSMCCGGTLLGPSPARSFFVACSLVHQFIPKKIMAG